MQDEVIFRRRQRLKYHFVNTSKVLLYGYHGLSDAAKITYQVIDGFDWEDKETGESKGYAFPATETIAEIRGISGRTVRRHLHELEKAGLLTRVRRRNRSSILYIENVSDKETDRYLKLFVDKKPGGNGSSGQGSPSSIQGPVKSARSSSQKSRTDKSVRSRQAPEMTKMSVLDEPDLNLPKEKEGGKKKNVNAVEKRSGEMQSMQTLVEKLRPERFQPQQSRGAPSERRAKRDYLAHVLADAFQDAEGLGCYRRIVEKIPESVIFQTLAEVKDAGHQGRIRSSRAALFVDAIKRYAERHQIDLMFGRTRGSRSQKWMMATGP